MAASAVIADQGSGQSQAKKPFKFDPAKYPFVPMDTRQVFKQVQLARQHLLAREKEQKNHTFLDIGCGIGNVLLVAEQMELDVFGFEKDEYPYKIGAKLIGEDRVTQEDIWQYDSYDTFDVIYYFRPFHQGEVQRKFELMIENQLKSGGVLIANRKMSEEINTDSRFKSLSPDLPVWVKLA